MDRLDEIRFGDQRQWPYTFSFLMLLYFAVFSVVSARERSWFWATLPSKTFMSALAADTILGTILTFVGLKDLMPLPWWQTLGVFGYAMVSCLVLNDAVKVAMIKWRVPNAVAVKAVDTTQQVTKDAPKPEDKGEAQPEARAALPPESKVDPNPVAKAEPQPDEAKAAPSPSAKAAPQPDAKVAPGRKPKPSPHLNPKRRPSLTPRSPLRRKSKSGLNRTTIPTLRN